MRVEEIDLYMLFVSDKISILLSNIEAVTKASYVANFKNPIFFNIGSTINDPNRPITKPVK